MKATLLHISDFHLQPSDPYSREVALRALVTSVSEVSRNAFGPRSDSRHGGYRAGRQGPGVQTRE